MEVEKIARVKDEEMERMKQVVCLDSEYRTPKSCCTLQVMTALCTRTAQGK
jgi:hypothetical protein